MRTTKSKNTKTVLTLVQSEADGIERRCSRKGKGAKLCEVVSLGKYRKDYKIVKF